MNILTMKQRPMGRWRCSKEAAEYIGASEWKLRVLVESGEIPVAQHEDGGPFVFDTRDLDAYMERIKQRRGTPDYESADVSARDRKVHQIDEPKNQKKGA